MQLCIHYAASNLVISDIANLSVKVTRGGASSQTLSFIIGESQTLPWLDELSAGLSVNQTAHLHTVPPGKSAVASVTIESVTPSSGKSVEEDFNSLREEGNQIYKNAQNFKDYRKAVMQYDRALNAREETDNQFHYTMRCNLSMAALRMEDWPLAIINADIAMAIVNAEQPKPLFRRATAFSKIDALTMAKADFQKANALNPGDSKILAESEQVSKKWIDRMGKGRQKFAEVYNVMLQSPLFKNPLLV